jgi:DNA-binding response OmpR family regulator
VRLKDERAIVLSAGCDDCIHKPFREADIFAMLEKHLGVRYMYEEEQQTVVQADIHGQPADGRPPCHSAFSIFRRLRTGGYPN